MALYVIANNDYLTDGYVDASFVGTDSDLYVNAGYTQDSVLGEASLSSTATLTTNGGKLLLGVIEVSSTFAVTADGDIGPAVGTSIPAGTFTTTVNAGVIASASGSISSAATTTTDADKIATGDVSISTTITTANDADKIVSGVIAVTPGFTTVFSAIATMSPGGDISVSATTTATASSILVAEVSITAIQKEDLLWSDTNDYSWDYDSGDAYWGPNVHVGADASIQGNSSISTSASVTADGDVTAIADISQAGAFTVDVTAIFETVGSANISTSATVAVLGTTNVVSENVQISSAFTTVATGIFQVSSQPIAVTSSSTLAVDADVIADSGVVGSSASATLTSTPSRTRPFVANLLASFSMSTDAETRTDATVIQAGTFTTTVNGDAIADSGAIGISSNFTVPRWVGGKLFGGIVDIQGFATTLNALTIYLIDPYRVYKVDSESRLLKVVEERRFYGLNSESRVNSIIEEQRELSVTSETRNLKVQTTKLVEVAGDPLDRREG